MYSARSESFTIGGSEVVWSPSSGTVDFSAMNRQVVPFIINALHRKLAGEKYALSTQKDGDRYIARFGTESTPVNPEKMRAALTAIATAYPTIEAAQQMQETHRLEGYQPPSRGR